LTPSEQAVRWREIARRLQDLPMVRATAWAERAPFSGTHTMSTRTPDGHRRTLSIRKGSSSYFDATGIRIVNGRTFTAAEVEQNAPVLVISQAAARETWPGSDPIGRAIDRHSLLGAQDTTRTFTVIGVAADVRTNFLSRIDPPTAYYPLTLGTGYSVLLI